MSNEARCASCLLYFQGRELLWSTREAALGLVIMETISRCSAPPAAAAATPAAAVAPSSHQQGSDEPRMDLLSTKDNLRGTFNKL